MFYNVLSIIHYAIWTTLTSNFVILLYLTTFLCFQCEPYNFAFSSHTNSHVFEPETYMNLIPFLLSLSLWPGI